MSLTKADLAKITHTLHGAAVDSLKIHGDVIHGRYGAWNPYVPGRLLAPTVATWSREGKHLYNANNRVANARLDLDLTPLQ